MHGRPEPLAASRPVEQNLDHVCPAKAGNHLVSRRHLTRETGKEMLVDMAARRLSRHVRGLVESNSARRENRELVSEQVQNTRIGNGARWCAGAEDRHKR